MCDLLLSGRAIRSTHKMRKFTSKIFFCTMFFAIVIILSKNYYHKNQSNFYRLLGSRGYYYYNAKKPGIKYILLWTSAENIPFVNMGLGQTGFIGRQCEYTNCFVSANESDLGSTTAYDAVLFAGPELIERNIQLPQERLAYQKFVFASIESPGNYPICFQNFNGYFNWTWTYKLDSDVRWGYIVIKDTEGNILGPNINMSWIKWKDMDPVDATLKQQLRSKFKAVAWFVSNCRTISRREDYAAVLKEQLMEYGLDIDVYGECGTFRCPREKPEICNEMLSRDYYFYLSFENAFSDDYVTEKLLHALQNNVVPIVFGGANYSRFLPERSYLNARELSIPKLAAMIYDLISEPDTYAEFFRWQKYYSYHRTVKLKETNEYCRMCAALNDDKLVKTPSVYNEFSNFWEVYNMC